MVPIRRRMENKGRTCSVTGCPCPAKALGLCSTHYSQQRRGEDPHTINDKKRLSEKRRAYWASLSPDARAAQVRAMHAASPPYERTAEWSRQASDRAREAWSQGRMRPQKPKVCRGCEITYQPNSGRQVYCTVECRLVSSRAERYGITGAELLALLAKQDGVCALCHRPEHGFFRGQPLMVDHCHDTGRVRGLLCGDCNTALGRFGDDPAKLRAAADYLERT